MFTHQPSCQPELLYHMFVHNFFFFHFPSFAPSNFHFFLLAFTPSVLSIFNDSSFFVSCSLTSFFWMVGLFYFSFTFINSIFWPQFTILSRQFHTWGKKKVFCSNIFMALRSWSLYAATIETKRSSRRPCPSPVEAECSSFIVPELAHKQHLFSPFPAFALLFSTSSAIFVRS
jgi:hypothetical protein